MTDEARDRVLDGLLREAARARGKGTEEFVSRIVRSLEDKPAAARRTRWPLWAAAACLAVLSGALALRYYQARRFAESVVARVERTDPGVSIERAGRSMRVVAGAVLAIGDRLDTAGEQRVSFVYVGEETRVRLGEKTSVILGRAGEGSRISLRRGKIEAAVAPRSGKRAMTVVTAHAEMAVLGTVFTVSASREVTGLRVQEGTVRMELPGSGRHENVTGGRVALARAGADRVMMPGRLVRTVRVEGLPAEARISGIAMSDDELWIHGSRGAAGAPILASIDSATGKIIREIDMKESFKPGSCLAWDGGLLWGFASDGTSLTGIDVRSGRTARTIPVPVPELSSSRIFDIRDGTGWLRGRRHDELVKVDLADGRILARVVCPFAIDRIAASDTSVYAGERGWNACRIDPADGRTAYAFLCEAESFTGDMSIDRDSNLWVARGTGPVIHVFEAE